MLQTKYQKLKRKVCKHCYTYVFIRTIKTVWNRVSLDTLKHNKATPNGLCLFPLSEKSTNEAENTQTGTGALACESL